eukprot:6177834-Pleurochrysis_carterae.AAC.5
MRAPHAGSPSASLALALAQSVRACDAPCEPFGHAASSSAAASTSISTSHSSSGPSVNHSGARTSFEHTCLTAATVARKSDTDHATAVSGAACSGIVSRSEARRSVGSEPAKRIAIRTAPMASVRQMPDAWRNCDRGGGGSPARWSTADSMSARPRHASAATTVVTKTHADAAAAAMGPHG